jgi:hypothetical protein
MKREKWDSALEIYSFLNSKEKLIELGDACFRHPYFNYAAKAYQLANDPDKLTKLGDECIRQGLIQTAYEIYISAGNETMAQFIRANFGNR